MEKEKFINPTREQFKELMAIDYKGPIWLVNLLKFKKNGGRESYAEYGKGMQKAFENAGGQIIMSGESLMTIIGTEEWDEILIVEFPSIDAHMKMQRNKEFQAAYHFRIEALEDSRFYAFKADAQKNLLGR